MVGDWRLIAGDVRSPLLIVEHPAALGVKEQEAIARFAREGGTVLLTGMAVLLKGPLRDLAGLASASAPEQAEPLSVPSGGTTHAVKAALFRIRPEGAETILAAKDATGTTHPFLTRHAVGKGAAWYAAIPLLSRERGATVPMPLLKEAFERVRPAAERLVATDAPDHVEVVLRRLGNRLVLHAVNMAKGERTVVPRGTLWYKPVTIHRLPEVPAHRVTLRVPARPKAVRVQPDGAALTGWRFEDGRLTFDAPAFAVHLMVEVELDRSG
jgi:hypothetical protein